MCNVQQYKHYLARQDSVLRYYERLGAAASKLIVGIPLYGQSFTLGSRDTGLGAAVAGPGQPGQWTKQRGMLAFYEICSKGDTWIIYTNTVQMISTF